jgi:hypothetical protein
VDLGELGVFEFLEAHTAGLSRTHRCAGSLMGHPERNSPAHQPFRDIGGERVPERCEFGHPVDVEAQRADEAGHRRQQQLQLRDRVEHRLLVLLEITVVRQGLRLERRQQPGSQKFQISLY